MVLRAGSVFALVAIPVPLGQAFSYAIPAGLLERLSAAGAGARVLCEFGRRKVMGVVLEVTSSPPSGIATERIKPLLAIVDEEPPLPAELLAFLKELAAYYIAPIGEVMRLALPAVGRSQIGESKELFAAAGLRTVGKLVQFAVLATPSETTLSQTSLKGQAAQVLGRLQVETEISVASLEKEFGNARAVVKKLQALGLIRIEERSRDRDPFLDVAIDRDQAKVLNAAQQVAVDAIVSGLRQEDASGAPSAVSRAFLLHGVTGSGKTEVYLHVVAECLAARGGAIVLVPEIALTPQLVARFRARFGDQIAVLHSGLSEVDRHQMWNKLRDGQRLVAVGARSALFAPVQNLRLICVDEEHDSSFKQDEGVRYHARDMALLRAHRSRAVCVLGSATPSLASVAMAEGGKLTRLTLPARAHVEATLPLVTVINLRQQGAGPTGHKLISLPLFRAIAQTLDDKNQVILFLNRRGFAPSLICESCGTVVECPNCSVSLTLHRSNGERLRCHYCDFVSPLKLVCTKCTGSRFTQEGIGTERVEQALAEAFPLAQVARLDRDVAEGSKSEPILDRMRRREIDILVGTQMVTKGHDLPDVALVGVLNADSALSLPDYQASERTFQLLVQVAGRAGRGGTQGKVLIQTRNPEHPAVRYAVEHDVQAFAKHELEERRDANYPPFCRMLMVRVDSLNDRLAQETADHLADVAIRVGGRRAEVLGPSAAPIERLRNRYRYRFLLRAPKRAPLFEVARAILRVKLDRRVRLSVDVDPVSML